MSTKLNANLSRILRETTERQGFSAWYEPVLLFVALIALGVVGPWWSGLILGFAIGLRNGITKNLGLDCGFAVVMTSAWLIACFVRDVSFGLRVSPRLAGLLGLKLSPLLYLVMLVLIGTLSWLAIRGGRWVRVVILGYPKTQNP